MKFSYQYKLSGGERRSGVCEAPDKDAVFARLRAQGIKPFDVKLAPGFVNRLRSYGKRGVAIAVLAVLLLALAAVLFAVNRRAARVAHEAQSTMHEAQGILATLDSPVRRQIIGDDAAVDHGVRTAWSDVFALQGERYLASYAIPGVLGPVSSCPPAELAAALESSPAQGTRHETQGTRHTAQGTIESRQIRAIVAGMKAEARTFLASGGSLEAYMRRLLQRQREEIGYYVRAKGEVDQLFKTTSRDEWYPVWEKRNAQLKRLGIRTILLPQEGDEKKRRDPLDEAQ